MAVVVLPGILSDVAYYNTSLIFNRRFRYRQFDNTDWPTAYYLVNGPPNGETAEMKVVREGLKNSNEETCNERVKAAIRLHRKCMIKHNYECPMNHVHGYLYDAGKAAIKYKLQNLQTISDLLNEAFNCQKTLEGFIAVVIFNLIRRTRVQGIFYPRQNASRMRVSLRAFKYLLDVGTKAKVQFKMFGHTLLNFIDECWQVCMRDVPSELADVAQRSDVLRLLVEYGPEIQDVEFEILCPKEIDDLERNPFRQEVLESRKIIAAVRPSDAKQWPLPSLVHICRYVIRSQMAASFQLPNGLESLPLPASLIRYLALEELTSIDETLGLNADSRG